MSQIVDSKSKNFFINFLKDNNFENIKETDVFEYYDISAEKNGKKYRFELKQRSFDSKRFGDSIIEEHKLNRFIDGFQKKEYDRAYLITFFTDKWGISDIFSPTDKTIRYGSHTTMFEDRSTIKKRFINYNINKWFEYGDSNLYT